MEPSFEIYKTRAKELLEWEEDASESEVEMSLRYVWDRMDYGDKRRYRPAIVKDSLGKFHLVRDGKVNLGPNKNGPFSVVAIR